MKEQLRAVAKEYARQFGKIIGIEPAYWVGEDMSVGACAFGDYYFNLYDMQEVIDHLDDWVEEYGTIEKVGDEVFDWYNWLLDNEIRISLYGWLNGNRPDKKTLEHERISKQLVVLRQVEKEYPTHSIGNVIKQLEARTKELSKTKEPKDQ
jgi:hypothetical protein